MKAGVSPAPKTDQDPVEQIVEAAQTAGDTAAIVEDICPPDCDVDLVIIGGGSGGVRAARVAASHGAKVVLAEEYRLGGTCVIRGCIPKKLLVYAGRYADMYRDAGEFGWIAPTGRFDWPTLIAAKDKEIARLENLYQRMQEAVGVEVVQSRGVIQDAHTVRLLTDGRRIRTKKILVATGARPEIPKLPGVELAITSNEVFDLPSLPKRVVVVGAGYIAMEFAGLFSALGSDVTVICRGDNVLRGFDEDLRLMLADSYKARGIKLLFGDQVVSLSRHGTDGNTVSSAVNPISVVTKNGARMSADQVVLAIGRVPNTRQLGLDTVGVEVDAIGAIKVSAMSQTNVPSIYAVGDVTNRLNLTPVAIRQGHAFADSAFSAKAWEVDYDLIPTAVFSTPEVGCVGLTELEARARHPAVDVYVTEFLTPKVELARTAQRTLLKVVVDGRTQRLLGVHLFSDEASELIQPLAIAMRAGATIDHLREAMVMHPSFSEAMLDLEAPTLRYDRIVPDPKAPDSTANNMPLRTAI